MANIRIINGRENRNALYVTGSTCINTPLRPNVDNVPVVYAYDINWKDITFNHAMSTHATGRDTITGYNYFKDTGEVVETIAYSYESLGNLYNLYTSLNNTYATKTSVNNLSNALNSYVKTSVYESHIADYESLVARVAALENATPTPQAKIDPELSTSVTSSTPGTKIIRVISNVEGEVKFEFNGTSNDAELVGENTKTLLYNSSDNCYFADFAFNNTSNDTTVTATILGKLSLTPNNTNQYNSKTINITDSIQSKYLNLTFSNAVNLASFNKLAFGDSYIKEYSYDGVKNAQIFAPYNEPCEVYFTAPQNGSPSPEPENGKFMITSLNSFSVNGVSEYISDLNQEFTDLSYSTLANNANYYTYSYGSGTSIHTIKCSFKPIQSGYVPFAFALTQKYRVTANITHGKIKQTGVDEEVTEFTSDWLNPGTSSILLIFTANQNYQLPDLSQITSTNATITRLTNNSIQISNLTGNVDLGTIECVLVEQETYTITIHPNNGNSDLVEHYDENSTFDINHISDITKTGYTLLGWSTSENGSSVNYDDRNNTFRVTDDVELWAVWEINTYTVTLNISNGSTVTTNPQNNVPYGSSVTWTVSANTGYTLPTTATNGTISGTSVTSNRVEGDMTVTVECVQSQQEQEYYWYVGHETESNAMNSEYLTNLVNGQNGTTSTTGPSTLTIPNTTGEVILYIYPTIWGTPTITYNTFGTGDTTYEEAGLTQPNGYNVRFWSGDSDIIGKTLDITWTK